MTLNLSVVDLVLLFFCAVTLGVVIHFFITSRRGLKSFPVDSEKKKKNVDEWKLKYFNEVEVREKELSEVKSRLTEAEEQNHIYETELSEVRKQQRMAQSELDSLSQHKLEAGTNKLNYIDQLRIAQAGLQEHNQKINQLLENIEAVKDTEEKQRTIEAENRELMHEVKDLKYLLSEKEAEVHEIRQKVSMTKEMTSMLDSAYSDFNTLQSKIQKLESQLTSNKMLSLEYEDLKEAYQRVSREQEESKTKLQTLVAENQQLTLKLNEVEDIFHETNFQKQQLQKRVGYLEELNNDLQEVANANKKLEHQLRRIGELESMLNVVSEENQLLKRQSNP